MAIAVPFDTFIADLQEHAGDPPAAGDGISRSPCRTYGDQRLFGGDDIARRHKYVDDLDFREVADIGDFDLKRCVP